MANIFRWIFATVPVTAVESAEEELVDPQVVLREDCNKNHCAALQELYDKCNERVRSKTRTTETCVEELFDLMECVDHCVAKTLFTKLK